MCDEEKIVRFSEDVICSDPTRTDAFMSKQLFGEGVTLASFVKEQQRIVYVTEALDTSEAPNDKAKWALVDLNKKYKGNPVYLLTKYDKDSGMFDGYLVGDVEHIMGEIEKKSTQLGYYARFSELKTMLNETAESAEPAQPEPIAPSTAKEYVDAMTHEIYENLLIDNWCSEAGLARFIKIIGSKLNELRANGVTKYYEENKTRHAIVNTGLINMYKQDVYVMYRYNMTKDNYIPFKQVKGRADWLDNGFDTQQIRELKPIRFFEATDGISDTDLDSIDISTDTYKHIIEENKDRLESVIGKEYSPEFIADRIRGAVSTSITMLGRDPGYAKPYYTATMGLSWMLPQHIRNSLSEAPEFGLILAKQRGGYYAVKTAIPYNDEAKDYLTASSLYGKKW